MTNVIGTLADLNRRWFEHHKHLSTDEMLAAGLIDPCDVGWVEALRADGDGYKTQVIKAVLDRSVETIRDTIGGQDGAP
jgi:hypothetical protein